MIQRRIFVLFLAVFLTMPMFTASAQTPASDDAVTSEQTLYGLESPPGLISAVSRSYGQPGSMDTGEIIGPASPVAAEDAHQTMVGFIDVTVYQFDTPENAHGGYLQQMDNVTSNLIRVEGPEKVIATQEELTGAGDAAFRNKQIGLSHWGSSNMETVVVQSDALVVSVTMHGNTYSLTGDSDADLPVPELQTLDVALSIASQGQPSAEDIVFAPDGTSFGGLWEYMPAEGDALLQGLAPIHDAVVYPVPAWQTGEYVDITEMPGLVDAVWRSYGGPNTFLSEMEVPLEATPVAAAPTGPTFGFVDVSAYRFEHTQHATAAFDVYLRGIAQSPLQSGQQGKVSITSEAVPDLGTQATRMRMDITLTGGSNSTEFIFVQRDELIIVVSMGASSFAGTPDVLASEVKLPTQDVAELVLAEGQPSTDEVVYADDGTSTGGLWGIMPGTSSGIMLEMQMRPLQDVVIFPMPTP